MSFRISIFPYTDRANQNQAERVVEVADLGDLSYLINQHSWSPSVFKDNYRSNTTVETIELLVFDIDEGMSISDAEKALRTSGYSFIIATSKSHQKTKVMKSGKVLPPCDRFRVIIPLEETITNDADLKATWLEGQKLFPTADPACKDAARFYFPCPAEFGQILTGGNRFPVSRYQPTQKIGHITQSPVSKDAANLPATEKGILSRSTLNFIAQGAESGHWHRKFFKAAVDLKEQGYSKEEAAEMLKKASPFAELDEHDTKLLDDVYDRRETKYGPRVIEQQEVAMAPGSIEQAVTVRASTDRAGTDRAGENQAGPRVEAVEDTPLVSAADLFDDMVKYLSDKDQVMGLPTGIPGLDKILGGGKRLGEITVTHAHAKTGKNTLWHAMMYRWLEKGIPIAYASRELSPESEVLPNLLSLKLGGNAWKKEITDEVKESYKTALSSWPLYFSKGYGCFPLEELTTWIEACVAKGVQYFWIDHLHYLLEDPEDHKYASKFIKELKARAKRFNIHIDLVVQPNRLQEGQRLSLDSIKGGAAIGQALDNLITLERVQSETPNITKLTLEVARSKLARPGKIYLQYSPETTDFNECELVMEPKTEERSSPLENFKNSLAVRALL